MPTSIAVICTLEELTAYSLADRQNRYFSLNLSMGLRGDSALPADSAAIILQPWKVVAASNTSAIDLVAYADSGQPGDQPSGTQFSITPLSGSLAVDDVKARLEHRYKDNLTANNVDYFHWSDDPSAPTPVQGETWPRVVAHASTYPAPIPQSLKLAFIFAVPVAALQGKTRLFAAPKFTIDSHTVFAPGTDPEKPGTTLVEWKYSSAPAGYQNAMSAFQAEFMLAALPASLPSPHYVDLNTGWIGTANGQDQTAADESLASEDWHSTLERRAGEAFDLGQRMLVALRGTFFDNQGKYRPINASHPTFGEADMIRDAVLAALHDTADVGLRYGPDGTNLVRFILLRSGVNDPVDLQRMEAQLHVATSGKGTPDLAAWTAILNGLQIATKVANPGAPGDPATGDYVRATLDLLDTVQSALATDAVLSEVVFQQWNTYLGSDPTWRLVNSNVQTKLNNPLEVASTNSGSAEIQSSRILRARMLLAAMGGLTPPDSSQPVSREVPIWAALTATRPGTGYADETADVRKNLQNLIAAYFHGRFGIQGAGSYAPYIPLFANRAPLAPWPADQNHNPSPDLTPVLQSDADTFGTTVLFPPTDQATLRSHPIIVQIADTTDAPRVAISEDVERKIAGVGLLIREESSAWTCANMANLFVGAQANPLVQGAPVPVRLKKRNNLKQPYLAYNSGSLVAQEIDDPKSAAFPQQASVFPPAAGTPDWSALFRYQLDRPAGDVVYTENNGNFTLTFPDFVPPGDEMKDWSRVPALKFGRSYTLLPFAISSSGALPPLLAASAANPFAPVKPSVFATNWENAGHPLAGYTRKVQYLRRVGVGAPRLQGSAAFPEIPASVVPLARDCQREASLAPILLLWKEQTPSVNFTIRPPSCDLETWDRWTAGLAETVAQQQAGLRYRHTRMAVASALARFSAKTTTDENTFDLSIDDPAVSGMKFSLQPVYSTGTAPADQTRNLTTPPPIAGTITGPLAKMASLLMDPVHSAGVAVSCSIGTTPELKLVDNQLTVTVPSGEVWKLTATPQVADTGKFETFALKEPGVCELLIEVAQAGIFDPAADTSVFQKHLWDQLTVARSGEHLRATLAPWKDLAHPNSNPDLIHNVDLRRQAWRWMGRPIAPLPSDWATAIDTGDPAIDDDPALHVDVPNSRVWELGSFAERPDEDCIVKQSVINFARQNPGPVVLLDLDLSADGRAQYYRFGIDVHSRYEGLSGMTLAPVRARAAIQPVVPGGTVTGYTDWKRQVMPPRVSGEIPKPKILLVMPLTTPHGNGRMLPDLLAIANEPCFRIGGLAEELHAQLAVAPNPSMPLSTPAANANPLPDVGPNQILDNTPMDQTLVASPDGLAAEPIGTTFDLHTSAPLFGNSCFRITPSSLGLPSGNLQHYLVKVSFTRRINLQTIGPYPSANQPQFLESKATDPFWVEFQPSFEHCSLAGQADPAAIADLRFSIAGGAVTFYRGTTPVTPIAGPPNSPQLELWLLLMRTVSDVIGASQMAAVDMLGPAFKTAQADSGNLVVYLLEVLRSPEFTGTFDSGFGKAAGILFPEPSGAKPNALARINRCSPPILNRLKRT